MGRKAIEKRDNQLIINIDEIEREQQALMLTKSNDLIHAKFNVSLFVQKLLNFSLQLRVLRVLLFFAFLCCP